MPATLTKVIDGKPAIPDDLTNEQTVKCHAASRRTDSAIQIPNGIA